MDLRIVNTCNNNCLYCLEQGLRKKKKFISKDFLFLKIKEKNKDKIISFYWWNPLLHPDLLEIIKFCKLSKFESIWILSNTYLLDKDFLQKLKNNWLSSFGFYFNWFDKKNHELLNWKGINYKDFLQNLNLLKKSWLYLKVVTHINNLNINTIARDVLILSEKYGINNFDFVNYFPFDKPYDNKEILEYNFKEKRNNIDNFFIIIKKLNLNVKFVKFSKDFFGDFKDFYDYNNGIVSQIWDEDILRLSWKDLPFCFKEKRCNNCFIKDKCKFYGV